MCLRGPAPTPSVKNEMPMPISSPRARFSACSRAQLVIPGDLHGQLQRPRVLAGVVLPAGLGGVRELLGPQQVLQPQLRRVHLQLGGQQVDHPLDQVHRLGDPERAGVGDAAGRLVGVDALHRAVRGLQVVAAGEDVEEAGRELGRLRGAVERAVVGQHVDLEAEDLAVPGRRDAAGHVVIPGEGRGHQVLAAVLHPLHRPAGDDRADDRQHVAGVDADLVAEAAADVRGDDLDLVLRDAGDQRVDRAVRVRGLVGRIDQQLAGHRVHAGDRAAGLHRRGMHSGIEHLLGDDDLGGVEDLRGLRRRRRIPSRRCGCRSCPRCRPGSPAHRGRARAWRRRPAAAARSRPRSIPARPGRCTWCRRRRTRPPGAGSAPCRWPAPPARRRTASASRPGPAPPGSRR